MSGRGKSRYRADGWLPGMKGEGVLEGVAKGGGVSFWGDENVLKLTVVLTIQVCKYVETTNLHALTG